jgi:hypothetical protein
LNLLLEDEMLPDKTLIQFVRRGGKVRGVLVAMKHGKGFRVGCSLCRKTDMPKNNRFDKKHAIEIAVGRIVLNDTTIPLSMKKDYEKFVDRCRRYYKTTKQVA